jgi:oligopeptide/dipeptide ABC transporter ATP-binding protein
MDTPLLDVRDVTITYRHGRQPFEAVSAVSFDVRRGESLGLVGESGCGKSSLIRSVVMLQRPSAGRIVFDGIDLTALRERELRPHRHRLQLVFQDPSGSLDPRWNVLDSISEPLWVLHGGRLSEHHDEARSLMAAVGLEPAAYAAAPPRSLSGGQSQRVAIARALAASPDLVVLDEPVSALDVSVQAQIINLLEQLRRERGLTYLVVSHDLAVIRRLCDRVAVMHLGELSEIGPTKDVLYRPLHPYSRLLVESVPRRSAHSVPRIDLAVAEMPSAHDPPSGCRFRTRCGQATDLCASERPAMTAHSSDHHAACHFPLHEPTTVANMHRTPRPHAATP